jgi:hypothetical protein
MFVRCVRTSKSLVGTTTKIVEKCHESLFHDPMKRLHFKEACHARNIEYVEEESVCHHLTFTKFRFFPYGDTFNSPVNG